MSTTTNGRPESFFSQAGYEQFQRRLERLTPAHTPQWGKMDGGQMLEHLCRAIGCGVGAVQLPDVSNLFSRTVLKFLGLYVIPRFPKNGGTVDTLRVVSPQNFAENKNRLRTILQQAYETKGDADWQPHTQLGKMSRKEWGLLITKHLDHHFRQFGV